RPAGAVPGPGAGHAAGAVRCRHARWVRAPSLAAVPGLPRGPGDVLRVVVVLQPAAPALRGGGHVRAAVRLLPLSGRIRAHARRPDRLPGLRLADHGPGAEPAAGAAGPVPAVAFARCTGAAAGDPR